MVGTQIVRGPRDSRHILSRDEIRLRGLELTRSQRAIVGAKVRLALAWLKQRDLHAAAAAFRQLLCELQEEFRAEELGGQGDKASLDELGLETRDANALGTAGVETIGELRALLATREGRRRLVEIPNFGAVVLAKLFTAVRRWDEQRQPSRDDSSQAGPSANCAG